MAPSLKVIIAGGGVAGLCLGIFLERAGIQYTILEKMTSHGPWGSALVLSPQVLRVFDQLGMLQELQELGISLWGCTYFKQNMTKIGSLPFTNYEERYGYSSLFFAHPELLGWLSTKIPEGRILRGKRVLRTMQNQFGVKVFCTDGSDYDGDILIGADGAYSAVRQSLYKNMASKNTPPPKSDTDPLRFNQFAILGITKSMSHLYPEIENAQETPLNITIASERNYTASAHLLKGGMIGWTLKGTLLDREEYDQESSFRFSEWGDESVRANRKEIENIPMPLGGTVGNLIDNTEHISKVMLEDKLFITWHSGRTCLIGDAAHKLIPAAGQGVNQAILDAICMANLLNELPSTALEDIERVFARFYQIRYSTVKRAIDGSAKLGNLIDRKGFLGNVLRTIALSVPSALTQKANDAINSGRPILNFVDPIPLRGTMPNTSPPYSLCPSTVAM